METNLNESFEQDQESIDGTPNDDNSIPMNGSRQFEPENEMTTESDGNTTPVEDQWSTARMGNIDSQMQPQHHNWTNNQYNNKNNGNSSNNGPPINLQQPIVLWIETKTEEGRSYYYHAETRETTWARPEGPNIKVVQFEAHDLAKKQQILSAAATYSKTDSDKNGDAGKNTTESISGVPSLSQQPPNMLGQPPPNSIATPVATPGSVMPHQPLLNQPPPNVRQQPPPMFQPPNMQPGFNQPPFCMPPPAYGFPGGPAAPWGVPPWGQHMHASAATPAAAATSSLDKPAKNLIIKPGVIDPAVIARAAEWSEYRAPDGRPYYHHAGRGESVWEKPQALRDMEAARMAAHSGATPQQAIASQTPPVTTGGMPPHLLPNPMMHMGQTPVPAASYEHPMAAYAAVPHQAPFKTNENTKAAQAAALEKEAKRVAEEKRKKEEEQKKAAAAAAKPIDKSKPVSSTPIPGTPWCVVWTGDGRVFFYNPSSRTSIWERPEELTDRKDVDKIIREPPDAIKATLQDKPKGLTEEAKTKTKVETQQLSANNAVGQQQIAVADTTDKVEIGDEDDDEVIKIRTESESSVEEVPTKRQRAAKRKTDASEAAVEAEQRAAKERAVVPLEQRVTQFKEMLREKDVSAFSTWEKELHKIVFDPRYLLLTSKERKQVFEKYVRDRAEEERKEKRNKMRQKREDFRKLMEDSKLHGKSSFSEFCQRNARDERFRGIEKLRERESLFNEFIVEVRRREKEDKLHKKEQIRKDFLDMLRERGDIERHTRWHDIKKKFESDSRYRAVESSSYREEYFEDFQRILKEEKRKQRELKEQRERERERERKAERRDREKERERKDRERERTRSRERERKDKDKEKDNSKDKTASKKRDEERKKREVSEEGERNDDSEDEVRNEHSDNSDADREREARENEVERLQKERDRQIRAEQSIREREKEVQRTLACHLRDRDKEREHHKRDEAIGHFSALLVDLVRNPDFTWKEVKRQLRKDHRWDLCDSLDREDREKIFNEHIDNLMRKKREKFREMLDELTQIELTSTWKEIKKIIKDDPRYLKYNSERGEREFRDYIKDRILSAKTALRELLIECKFISHKSIDLIKENPNHFKEIQDILKNDKRYLVLEHHADERRAIVMSYLEELNKRGPPPPPTASESTRRNK